MNDKRELRRNHLLKILDDNPLQQYAMITVNMHIDPHTLVICKRDAWCMEMEIEKVNYDPFKFLKLVHEVKYVL